MRLLFLLVSTLALASCQAAPAPQPKAQDTDGRAAIAGLAAEAAALTATGQYREAVERYRQALATQGDSVAIRFGLGVAYSHLDRRAEATEQFRWVAQRADRDKDEYRAARRWLAQAGVSVDSSTTATAATAERATASRVESGPVVRGDGWLTGNSTWPGIDPRARAWHGELTLTGEDGATGKITRSRPFGLGLQYDVPDLVPGRYRLTASIVTGAKHMTLWDQTVVIQADQRTQLVLTPATAKLSTEEFPPTEPK